MKKYNYLFIRKISGGYALKYEGYIPFEDDSGEGMTLTNEQRRFLGYSKKDAIKEFRKALNIKGKHVIKLEY